ncbi:hypothetical protein [Puia dinghuensis]|uniref:Lipocalin-like domain-containing protein n=1 Tax=Puia dinghuensis TaxID=1792502 RepID=A0A8J2UFG7_9BACT|nr:hypothetical protein [Puia dinghuensis]GGB07963.1 hypothetical protein GCM10011511_34360 [Puia dinghuensis]
MTKTLMAAILLCAASLSTKAQCDKKVVLTASKTEHLKADSSLDRSVDEKSVLEFDKTNFTVNITSDGAEEHKMTGTVKSYTCDWKTPFKEGKTVLKVTLADEHESHDLTITIAGKGGKISFLAEADDMPDKKLRLVVDSFEEKK